VAPSRVPRLFFRLLTRVRAALPSGRAGALRREGNVDAYDRAGLTRNASVFLFRRDKSRLYGSLDLNASCRDRKAAAPKKDTLPSCYPNLVNESWYILSNPGTSWFRRGIISDASDRAGPDAAVGSLDPDRIVGNPVI